MTYQVYAFAPHAELIDEVDELDEAIARCEELVHEDGYPVAEIWDSAGDRVHAVGRSGDWTRGASGPAGAAATSEPTPGFGFAEAAGEREPDEDASEQDAAPVDDGETSASSDRSTVDAARGHVPTGPASGDDADDARLASRPPSVIDNVAAAPVQWFGV